MQHNGKQNNTKQSNTMQWKPKQSKAKQSKLNNTITKKLFKIKKYIYQKVNIWGNILIK